jgi:AraC-like DNA-binding protein
MSAVVHLAPPVAAAESPLGRVRELVLRHTPREGHTRLEAPDLCAYRFSRSATFTKAASLGVTLGVVLQGTKRIRIDGRELTVDPLRVLVITREREHYSSVCTAAPDRPYVGMSVCFSPERVASALLALADAREEGKGGDDDAIPAFVMPCDAKIAGALERLVATLDDPLDRKLLAPLVLDEILLRLLRSDAAAAVRSGVANGADAGRIVESMRFIREHHPEKLSVPALARSAAMSPSHFAHRFRAIARTSPMRYLREVRLDRARAMLVEKGVRASQVALDVGFESPAHFAREFKRRFGVPPSHYLREPGGRGRAPRSKDGTSR